MCAYETFTNSIHAFDHNAASKLHRECVHMEHKCTVHKHSVCGERTKNTLHKIFSSLHIKSSLTICVQSDKRTFAPSNKFNRSRGCRLCRHRSDKLASEKQKHLSDMNIKHFSNRCASNNSLYYLDLNERYSQSDEAGFKRNQPHCALESRVMC